MYVAGIRQSIVGGGAVRVLQQKKGVKKIDKRADVTKKEERNRNKEDETRSRWAKLSSLVVYGCGV